MRRLLFALLFLASPVFASELTPDDTANIRKVMDRYVAAWLAGDAGAVMGLLTPDSVLIPGAKAPHTGADAIRNYWWPPNSPGMTLTRFDNPIGDLAVVRGTQHIEWTTANERWRTKGNFVTVLRRTPDGWRIALQVAASTPSEKVP
jgi:uncharacterized protein (TIGR02246 family)